MNEFQTEQIENVVRDAAYEAQMARRNLADVADKMAKEAESIKFALQNDAKWPMQASISANLAADFAVATSRYNTALNTIRGLLGDDAFVALINGLVAKPWSAPVAN